MQRSATRAFIWAPLAALLAYYVVALGYVLASGKVDSARAGAGHALFFILLFGGPVVYAATLILGVPLYFVLRRLGLVQRLPVLAGGGLIGGIVLAWFTQGFWGNRSWNLSDAAVGAGCGVVGGLVFWWLVPRSNHDAPAA